VTPGRPRPRRARTGALAAALTTVLVAGLVAMSAVPAAAHDQLLSTDPADGSTLDAAPTAVTLVFSEDVLDISTTVVVTGPAGDMPVQVAVDGSTVTATLTGDQPDGAYTVTWRIVSSDGHPVQGAFGYALAAPVPAPAPIPTPTATASPDPTPTSAPAPTPSPSATASPDAADDEASPSTAVLVVALAVLAAALGTAAALRARHRTSRSTR
jgi:methionine-rich copper-binding protein CopC